MDSHTTTGHPRARPVRAACAAICSFVAMWIAPIPGHALDVSQSELLAEGLNNPAGIAFAPDGGLYVTEVGNGGPANADHSNCTFSPPQPAIERCYGETGALVRILPGAGVNEHPHRGRLAHTRANGGPEGTPRRHGRGA